MPRFARLVPSSPFFIVLLGVLSALPPLSIDMNLPAIPTMAADLHRSTAAAGMTLSTFLAGFAFAPLMLAPLSDHFGRRPVLVFGLVTFALAGLVCAVSPSLDLVLVGRLLQGMGAGIGAAMPLAIIRDSFAGNDARSRMSYVTSILSIAPLVAPSLGAFVLPIAGWRGIFFVLAAGGFCMLAAVALGFDESLREKRSPQSHPRQLPRAYAEALGNRRVVGFMIVNAFLFACLFGFVSGSPLVMMGHLALSPTVYALVFGCTACGLVGGSLVGARLSRRIAANRLLIVALVGDVVVTALLFILAACSFDRLPVMLPLIVASQFCYGLAMPQIMHEALQPLPHRAGVVSAALRGLQMLTGAAASALFAGLMSSGFSAPIVMTGIMSASTLAALIGYLTIARA
jgi:DHA1 family bicyclomycin/chloramphenicol resistance-like MFS transporter